MLKIHERPVFADLADAQASSTDYFDYYNYERLYSSIDYQASITLISSFFNSMP